MNWQRLFLEALPEVISSFRKGGLRRILGSLVLSEVEGLLLCIKTKKLKSKVNLHTTIKNPVSELSKIYNFDHIPH
jgi:hypothetical protein